MNKFTVLKAGLALLCLGAAPSAFAATYLLVFNQSGTTIDVQNNRYNMDRQQNGSVTWTWLNATVNTNGASYQVQDLGTRCSNGGWDVRVTGGGGSKDACVMLNPGDVGCVALGVHSDDVVIAQVPTAYCAGNWWVQAGTATFVEAEHEINRILLTAASTAVAIPH